MKSPASMPSSSQFYPVTGAYHLQATLVDSGQAFGWRAQGGGIYGVIGTRVYRLRPVAGGIEWLSSDKTDDGGKLRDFLQMNEDLEKIVAAFPLDPHMQAAVQFAPGLRLVRQDPWECLASFLISPLKQIVQIKQVLALLRQSLGSRIEFEGEVFHSFPSATQVAAVDEEFLRSHKMGFRARNLLGTSKQIAQGEVDLEAVAGMNYNQAVEELSKLRGVGRKIADCVLLFAYGKQEAFPIDVWIERVLHRLYFPRARKMNRQRLEQFAGKYFRPYGGYAQQYLFHYIRHHPRILD